MVNVPFERSAASVPPAPVGVPATSRSAMAGFTLVELLIVISILGFLAALAGPSFRDFVISQRIKTTAFELFADLTFARSEAIKVNSEVIVAKAGDAWTDGWNITWVDTGGTARTLRSHRPLDGTLTLTGSLDQINFQRNGRPLAGTETAKFTLDDTAGKSALAARCVSVDPSGRPNATTGACP